MRLLCALLFIACAASAQAAIQTREMPYRSADGTRMVGYFAYDDSKPGIRPGVIVVHEWVGLNDYANAAPATSPNSATAPWPSTCTAKASTPSTRRTRWPSCRPRPGMPTPPRRASSPAWNC